MCVSGLERNLYASTFTRIHHTENPKNCNFNIGVTLYYTDRSHPHTSKTKYVVCKGFPKQYMTDPKATEPSTYDCQTVVGQVSWNVITSGRLGDEVIVVTWSQFGQVQASKTTWLSLVKEKPEETRSQR